MIQIDMEMPKCCDECFALDDHGDYPFCLISQDQRGYTFNTKEKRMPTCPLKAQEARVMTLEEVNTLDWDYCYLEQERLPGKEYRGMLGKYIMTCVTWPSITAAKISYSSENYGKTWRCWTFRPTEAEREAVKWE